MDEFQVIFLICLQGYEYLMKDGYRLHLLKGITSSVAAAQSVATRLAQPPIEPQVGSDMPTQPKPG